MTFVPPRSALFLPASKPRAIEKAATLDCDMVILDLEDAVPDDLKDEARTAAVAAVAQGFGGRLVGVRINTADTAWHHADLAALAGTTADMIVLPKVERPEQAAEVAERVGRPVIAMIETATGILAAPAIARAEGVAGLMMGLNDLRNDLRIPASAGRERMAVALQSAIIAARAAGIIALDGVWNKLDDPEGLEAECRDGRALGFDGKSIIHPSHIEATNRLFGPDEAELEDARALIAAFNGGAERFRDRMIENMHVVMARRLIARAEGLRESR